jgi:hypothetical protein
VALAARQHGVVSHAQLIGLGLGNASITERVRTGRLHRLHRGVFAVGHTSLTVKSRWMAAVLALQPDAVLSHRSAAALHGLRPSSNPSVDVLIPRRSGPSKRDGIGVHRTTTLPASERTEVDGIHVTSWARTLLDLAAVVNQQSVAKALERSEELRLFDFPTLAALVDRHPGHQGIGKLRRALVLYEPRSKSELQRLFRKLCDDHGLPRPEEEQDIGDREQEARMVVDGYTVLRPTWDDVTANARRTAGRVRKLLSR